MLNRNSLGSIVWDLMFNENMRRILISIQKTVHIETQETRKSAQRKLPYKFYFVYSKHIFTLYTFML